MQISLSLPTILYDRVYRRHTYTGIPLSRMLSNHIERGLSLPLVDRDYYPTRSVTISIPAPLLKLLDGLAKSANLSRSALARQAIDAALTAESEELV